MAASATPGGGGMGFDRDGKCCNQPRKTDPSVLRT
jgi:hypothetical protein